MQVVVEKVGTLGRKVAVTIPSEKIDVEVDKRIAELAKTVKMKGFRPGKVPVRIVKERYEDSARQDVLEKALPQYVEEVLKQEDLRPAGIPNVNITVMEADKPFEFTLTFDVYPEINLVDFKGVDIEQVTAGITEEDMEKAIEHLRKQHVKWAEVERAAQTRDQVTIDFEGFIDDKPFEGGKAEQFPLELGSKSMIPGFEEGIVGAKPGETRDITVTFPAEYHVQDLAGKETKFVITVHKVAEPKLPELDDTFAKKVGDYEDVQELRSKMRATMERELEGALKMRNKALVLDKLLELNAVELPKGLVEQEMESLRQYTLQQYRERMHSDKVPEVDKEIFRERAERRVRLGLLLEQVIKSHSIEPDPNLVRALVEQASQTYQKPDQVVEWYYADKKRLESFEHAAIEEQAITTLLQTANVVSKSIDYSEALKSAYQAAYA